MLLSCVTPVRWECPACQDNRGRNPRRTNEGHTFIENKCRFSDSEPPPRKGAHPKGPREKATTHSSAEASSHDVNTEVLGVRGNANPGLDSYGTPQQASSSSSSPQDPPAAARSRGLDIEPRTRRMYESTGTGPDRLLDWTRFNVQISLRNVRSGEPSVVQNEFSKLHLRWWHASAPKMRHIL